MVCLNLELVIRHFFSGNPSQFGSIKSKLMELIKADDDVQFFWAIVLVKWEEEESLALLEQNN